MHATAMPQNAIAEKSWCARATTTMSKINVHRHCSVEKAKGQRKGERKIVEQHTHPKKCHQKSSSGRINGRCFVSVVFRPCFFFLPAHQCVCVCVFVNSRILIKSYYILCECVPENLVNLLNEPTNGPLVYMSWCERDSKRRRQYEMNMANYERRKEREKNKTKKSSVQSNRTHPHSLVI